MLWKNPGLEKCFPSILTYVASSIKVSKGSKEAKMGDFLLQGKTVLKTLKKAVKSRFFEKKKKKNFRKDFNHE